MNLCLDFRFEGVRLVWSVHSVEKHKKPRLEFGAMGSEHQLRPPGPSRVTLVQNGSGLLLKLDALIMDLFAIDGNRGRRFDAEPNPIPLDRDYHNADVAIDHDFFADSP